MIHSEACPLCAATEGATHPVDICGNCHAGLHLSGALPVSVTGEFSAVSDELLKSQAPAARGEAQDSSTNCCWCSKPPEQVKKMLSQGSYRICNECIALCADILQMELGENYGA